jgi:hypothetical protein
MSVIKRRATYASQCPVTRGDHEWIDLTAYGDTEVRRFCGKCQAEGFSVDVEWAVWSRNEEQQYEIEAEER